jgi:hypothetical protein
MWCDQDYAFLCWYCPNTSVHWRSTVQQYITLKFKVFVSTLKLSDCNLTWYEVQCVMKSDWPLVVGRFTDES